MFWDYKDLFSEVVVMQMESALGRLCCAFNQALKCYKFFWKDGCRNMCVCTGAAVHVTVLINGAVLSVLHF